MTIVMRTGWIGLMAFAVALAAAAQSLPPRRSFEIVTGPAAGNHFAAGEIMARLMSHPPGLARCEKSPLCGPPGAIVSAKSSDGSLASILAVASGAAPFALVESTAAADAIAGRDSFHRYGPQAHIRVVADLVSEPVLLVVARRSAIRSIADLKSKRVSLGSGGSTAEAILTAYGIKRVRVVREDNETSGGLLREGRIDAFFAAGVAPLPLVADMVGRGQARLIAIDGKRQARLLAVLPGLVAETLPAGTYKNTPALPTVASHTLWIARDSVPADTVYQMVRALYHPGNRAALASTGIRPGDAASLSKLPLHPGAARYWREAGILK